MKKFEIGKSYKVESSTYTVSGVLTVVNRTDTKILCEVKFPGGVVHELKLEILNISKIWNVETIKCMSRYVEADQEIE